jgi:predicted TIM-barrel fold metal-dependent hydrolase
MIDCHAHAYPTPGRQVGRALAGLAGLAARFGQQEVSDALGLLGRFAEQLPALPLVTSPAALKPEQVAELRQRVPAPLRRLLDGAGALFAAPQVLALGDLPHLLDSMDRHGLERAVVIAGGPLAPNEWLLEEAAGLRGERLVPVVVVPDLPPEASVETWGDALRGLEDAGAAGFKIHLAMDGLPPDHAAYAAVFGVAAERKKFVIVHTGRFELPGMKRDAVGPLEFARLLEAHRDVPVCLAHMNRDEPEAAWEAMRRFEQVYTDTSWQPAEVIVRAVEAVGRERILLGSDWPLLDVNMQGSAVATLRAALGDDGAERVGEENARRFLGLPEASPGRASS